MQVYRTMHSWHWISAAICLAALLMFCITGITLNHAGSIGASPSVRSGSGQVPDAVRASLAGEHANSDLPAPLGDWIEWQFQVSTRGAGVEWSDDELYLSAPAPGRDAWVSIDRHSGAAKFEVTDRGWIAFFNDLHKGRNTGALWSLFIDLVAAACVFFALTGLVLLWIQARQRTSTWPLVASGCAILVVLMIFFAHQ